MDWVANGAGCRDDGKEGWNDEGGRGGGADAGEKWGSGVEGEGGGDFGEEDGSHGGRSIGVEELMWFKDTKAIDIERDIMPANTCTVQPGQVPEPNLPDRWPACC